MAVHLITPAAPAPRIPRAHPCAARLDQPGRDCGAVPALLYRRVCLHGHVRDAYLCRAHEQAAGAAVIITCRDCAGLRDGAHRCPVALIAVPEALDVLRSGRLPLIP